MRVARCVVAMGWLVVSCSGATTDDANPRAPTTAAATTTTTTTTTALAASRTVGVPARAPIRLVFVGDVMLGRGVAPVVQSDPTSVFEGLRPAVARADLAFGNLESPLTRGRHLVGEHALEADPAAAALLAGAGFDVLGVANNHASDAGPATVVDTLAALRDAGLLGVGGGHSTDATAEPLVLDVGGTTVGIAAFELSGGGRPMREDAGVNTWDVDDARAAVTDLRNIADVVVVGLHGGVEYLPRPDPALTHVVNLLADWGADVVWGHGSHVSYPVDIADQGGRISVVAPGLGNALFDQLLPRTEIGTLLEVLVCAEGVLAMRTGRIEIDAGRSTFAGWDEPNGDAVALDGDWWTPVAPWTPFDPGPQRWGDSPLRNDADEVARSIGDVTGTGEIDLVVAYRRPSRLERAHATFDEVDFLDEQGRTAHVAVYTSEGRMRWGSAVMFQPVGSISVCDGSMAVGLTTTDDTSTIGGGAWVWDGFGFRTAPVLQGIATPTCADIDLDGRADPVLTERDATTKPIGDQDASWTNETHE